MNLLGVVAVAALALVPLQVGATPITEPIVFDFEDGLQGWELLGSAQRVQTQLLGGEWAIFGDGFLEGGASLLFRVDLSRIPFVVTFDVFTVEGDGAVRSSVLLPIPSPTAAVSLNWGSREDLIVAFIDNITFHPVPEPSTLVLLVLSLAAVAVSRLRIR